MRKVPYTLGIILSAVLAAAATPALADTLLVEGHPQQYVVRKGDTLWDIAGRFLAKPWRWPELWQINKHIENPHLIYPGDLLRVVYDGDQPFIELVRGGAGTAAAGAGAGGAGASDIASGAVQGASGSRDVKLSPEVKVFYREAEPIYTVPLERIYAFLRYTKVVGIEEYDSWPYVLSVVKDGRFVPTLGDETGTVYVRGKLDPKVRSYSVYRESKALRSPRSSEPVGRELIYVGVFVVTELGSGITHRGRLIEGKMQLQKGDRLYPEDTFGRDALTFSPQPVPAGLKANILSVLDAELLIGENNVIAVDVGTNDGVRPGMVLPLYNNSVEFSDSVSANLRARQEAATPLRFKGEDSNFVTGLFSNVHNTMRDFKNKLDATPLVEYLGAPQQQPDTVRVWPEYNGQAVVFRTFDAVSYALVVELERPAYIEDLLLAPDMVLGDAR